jgi:N-acetylmuramoyl-L-alanine amidase
VGITESGDSIYEADITLPVELDTMSLLRAAGYTVVVSRTTNATVLKMGPEDFEEGTLTLQAAIDEVEARDRCANLAHAEAMIGIYFDSGSGPDNAGCLTGYDTARPFAAANARLAQLVQTDVLDALNAKGWDIPDQGAVTDDELGSLVPSDDSTGPLTEDQANYDHLLLLGPGEAGYQLSPSEMPGVVVEPLYLTDPFEGSIAASETGQRVIGRALADAVEQFLPPLHPWRQGVIGPTGR